MDKLLTRIRNTGLKEERAFQYFNPGPGHRYDRRMIDGSSTKGKDRWSNLRFKESARIWEMKRFFKAEKKGA
jgi:hypothetical protein